MLSHYCSTVVKLNLINNNRRRKRNDGIGIFSEQSPAEEKKQKEEKKRYLLRKLSFRPTVEELKEKKVINI